MKQLARRLLLIFCALDHLTLVIFTFGNCKPYEQVSGALWSLEQDGKILGRIFRPAVDFGLCWLEKDHCRRVWSVEQRQIIIMGLIE